MKLELVSMKQLGENLELQIDKHALVKQVNSLKREIVKYQQDKQESQQENSRCQEKNWLVVSIKDKEIYHLKCHNQILLNEIKKLKRKDVIFQGSIKKCELMWLNKQYL